jgi:effector-binding domain-containing protein
VQTIKARDILQTPLLQVWELFTDKHYNVVYDDGQEEVTSSKSIIFNRYIWIPFGSYTATPITKDCSVQSVISRQYFTADVHIRLLESVFKNICKHNHLYDFEHKDALLKIIYQTYNAIYIDYVNRISTYVTTIDAVDFVEAANMPEIKNIHSNIKPTADSIEQTYKDLKKTLTSTSNLNNMFIHAYKSKSINENQANQCLGVRGVVAGKDRTVYKQPIMSGFITGMSTLYDMAAESTTAAKALTANDKHIAASEYNSRLLQLLTMVVESVKHGDCGSTEYYDFLVTPGSLSHLKGKYHLHDNVLKCIDGTENDLENTIIKLRTAIGCTLRNQHCVCSTCLGEVSRNFRADTNLGYVFTAYIMEKAGQNILSSKHLTHSVKSNTIHLDGDAAIFFQVKADNFYLNKLIDYSNVAITLDSKQLPKLMDVLNLSHSYISLEKIGEINTVIFTKDEHSKKTAQVVNVQHGDRCCILSKDFLEYIRHINIYSDHKGNYIVPLNRFNVALPIFTMPVKENNMINFITRMASILQTNYDKVTDPYDKLTALYTHMSKQFSVSLTVLETLVYATTTYNAQQNDLSLGRNSVNKTTESLFNLSKGRSMSLLFSTENQESAIFDSNMAVFNNKNVIDHPMDVFFDPHEVLKHSHHR